MKKLLYLFVGSLLLTSCAKDGEDGKQGPAGNANVHSFDFSVTPGDWLTSGTAGSVDHAKYVELTVPEVTQDIIDNGMVVTYIELAGYYIQMPTSLPASSTVAVNFFTAFKTGIVEVDLQLSNLQTPNTASANYTFKVVVADGVARVTHPEVNWHDINQVKEVFNLN